MKIDPKLNIVIPVDVEGKTFHVYSSPISIEVFKAYHLPIAKTFSALYNEGLHFTAGPRVAAMILEDKSRALGLWDGPAGVEMGLMNEIRRLTSVLLPSDKGWVNYPLQDVVDRNLMSPEDVSEVENILTFFIVTSAMHRKAELGAILNGAAKLWDAQITSSGCSEFAASLPKLTVTANSAVKTTAGLSVPS